MATPGTTPIRPVLTLSTDHIPDQIVIDGLGYDLRGPGDLTIHQSVLLHQLTPRHDALIARQHALTEDESNELAALLVRIVPLLVDAPVVVLAKLRDAQRIQIVTAFTSLSPRLLWATRATAGATTVRVPKSHGTSKSRVSSASTVARSRRG